MSLVLVEWIFEGEALEYHVVENRFERAGMQSSYVDEAVDRESGL